MLFESVVSMSVKDLNGIDAVVSSVNNRLRHGSGIAKELSDAAGNEYGKSCSRLLRSRGNIPIPIGTAHLANAGGLATQGVKFIINACAMGYSDTKQRIPATRKTLTSAVEASLVEANTAGCQSIIFPLMCVNAGGLKSSDSARWTIDSIRRWIFYNPNNCIKNVYLNSIDFRNSFCNYEQVWQDALRERVHPVRATKYLELLEIARDELLRLDKITPFSLDAHIVGNIDEALYAAGYS
jgi:O-acetyl-ADP-ribose deacetylase (regulator of RNase III)